MWDPRATRCVSGARSAGGASGLPGPAPLPSGEWPRAGAGDPRGGGRAGHPCGPRAHPGADPGLSRGVGHGAAPAFSRPGGDEGSRCDRVAAARGLPRPHPGTEPAAPGPTSHLPGATPGRPALSDEKSRGRAPGHALGLAGARARRGICGELGESGGFLAAGGSGIQPRAGLFLSPPDRERGLPERGFTVHCPRPNESRGGGAVGAQGQEAESPEAQSSASDQTRAQSPEPGRRAHGEP